MEQDVAAADAGPQIGAAAPETIDMSAEAEQVPPQDAASGEAPPRVPPAAASVDLASLLAREMPIDAFEAMAVVQALCARVLARGPEGNPRVPEARDISITAEGGIELRGDGPADQAPVLRASRLLQALLSEAQAFPGALQALARDEMATVTASRSLQEFSARLERFERPGRSFIIRGVYERFRALPAAEAPSADEGAPPPSPMPAPVRPWWHSWLKSKEARAFGVVAAIVFVLTTALLFLWPRPHGRASGDSLTASPTGAAPAADTALQTADAPAAAGRGGAGSAKPRSRRSGSVAARPAAPGPRAETTARVAPFPVDASVYSAADAEVVPPVVLRPHLPKDPPPGVRIEDLPEVELIVSERGDVESVRMVSESSSVVASMMLSAVKNWLFEPATRNGQPVRYRLRVRLPHQ